MTFSISSKRMMPTILSGLPDSDAGRSTSASQHSECLARSAVMSSPWRPARGFSPISTCGLYARWSNLVISEMESCGPMVRSRTMGRGTQGETWMGVAVEGGVEDDWASFNSFQTPKWL